MEGTTALEVITFIRDELRTRKPLSMSTELLNDLGLYGEDAEQFMITFARRCGMNETSLLPGRRFPGEGSQAELRLCFRKFGDDEYEPTTVAYLVDAALRDEWPKS